MEKTEMYVILRNPTDYMKLIFEGYRQSDVVIERNFTGVMGKINALHNSISKNRFVPIPFKPVWYPFYLDYKRVDESYSRGEQLYIIFFEGNRLAYQKKYLEYIKKRYPGCKLIFRYINIISKDNDFYLDFVKGNYDLLITMDRNDALKYQMLYKANTYWLDKGELNTTIKRDVLFLGGSKGRKEELIKLAEELEKNDISFDFYVAGNTDTDRVERNGIHYIKGMSYRDYIELLVSSRASLEITASGQIGSTLRVSEAVFFDKILLTTNKEIVNEEYYDSRYMILINESTIGTIRKALKSEAHYETKEMIAHRSLFQTIEIYFRGRNE